MALKSWDDICKPKAKRGFGFRRFADINMALLAKLAWKIALEEDSWWTHILSSKYLRGNSFFQHNLNPGASNVWKGIVGARQWLFKGACFQMGDGCNINIWHDPWIPGLIDRMPTLGKRATNSLVRKVANLEDENDVGWNTMLMKEMFPVEVANCILNIK